MVCVTLLLASTAAGAQAQEPVIGGNGVWNAASRLPAALARGSLFVVEGANFHGPLQVRIAAGSRAVMAPIHEATSRRIEARMPSNVPLGDATLTVSAAGRVSHAATVRITSSSFGIYSANGLGWGPGAIALSGNGIAVLSGTGLGTAGVIQVLVGGIRARVVQVRRGAKDEITFAIPRKAPQSCWVPVQVLTGPEQASNTVSMPVSAVGPCQTPAYFPLATWAGKRVGLVVVSRTVHPDYTEDEALAAFLDLRSTKAPSGPLVYLPPRGTCAFYQTTLDSEASLATSFAAVLLGELPGSGLNAGIRVTAASGKTLRSVPAAMGAPGVYKAGLGSSRPEAGRRRLPLFLNSGDLRIAGGGSDVGAFVFSQPPPAPFEWTNREALRQADRGRTLRVEWKGPGSGFAMAILVSNGRSMCYCIAPAEQQHFEVPSYLLRLLPAGEGGTIHLISLPVKDFRKIPAAGLDSTLAFSTTIQQAAVNIH
ncbi:MAG: hypothetical protein IT165_09550 [Bryobacterales bacterium]|nr:hypothetical protein [Bryobacterales bacterium]